MWMTEALGSTQFLPQKNTTRLITKINWLMLFKEIIVVCSGNHMKPINTLCGQNAELLSAKAGDTYSYHWTLKS
jgi:hypothetical protein